MTRFPVTAAVKTIFFVLSAGAFVGIVVLRMQWLRGFYYPITTDGYFYLQEFRSYTDTGHGYYTSHLLFFLLAGFLGRVFSLNEFQLFHLTFLSSLTILSCALALRPARKRCIWLMPAFFLLPWGSDILFFCDLGFLRQGFSFALLVFGFALALPLASTDVNKTTRRIGLLIAALGMSMHVFVFVIGAGMLLAEAPIELRLKIGTAVLGAILVVCYAFLREKHIFEPETWRLVFGWQAACYYMNCARTDHAEMFLQALSFCFFIWLLLEKNESSPHLYAIVTFYLIFSLGIWNDRQGMTYRLVTASSWLVYSGWSFFIAERGETKLQQYVFAAMIVVSAACWLELGHRSHNHRPLDQELRLNSGFIKNWIPEDGFVLAPRGFEFAATYYLNRSSSAKAHDTLQLPNFYRLTEAPPSPACLSAETLHELDLKNARCISFDGKMAVTHEGYGFLPAGAANGRL